MGWKEVPCESTSEGKTELVNTALSEALDVRARLTPRGEAVNFSRAEFHAFGVRVADLHGRFVKVPVSAQRRAARLEFAQAATYYVPVLSDIKWLPIKSVDQVRWWASHQQLASGAVANLQRQIGKEAIGMLEIVVGFERKELIDRVLLAPKLVEERARFPPLDWPSMALRIMASISPRWP